MLSLMICPLTIFYLVTSSAVALIGITNMYIEDRPAAIALYQGIRRCISEKQCARKDDRWHIFAETLAWWIADKSKANWRIVPALWVEGTLILWALPIQLVVWLFQQTRRNLRLN